MLHLKLQLFQIKLTLNLRFHYCLKFVSISTFIKIKRKGGSDIALLIYKIKHMTRIYPENFFSEKKFKKLMLKTKIKTFFNRNYGQIPHPKIIK